MEINNHLNIQGDLPYPCEPGIPMRAESEVAEQNDAELSQVVMFVDRLDLAEIDYARVGWSGQCRFNEMDLSIPDWSEFEHFEDPAYWPDADELEEIAASVPYDLSIEDMAFLDDLKRAEGDWG